LKTFFMPRLFSCISVLVFLCLSDLALLPSAGAADDREVAIIVSSHIKPFVLALDGFRGSFPRPVSITYVDANPEFAKHKLAKGQFSLIVAIGPEAAKIAWSSTGKEVPKIVLMVLDPLEILTAATSLCGIHLRVPASEQLQQLNDRMGPARKVGILYNPQENEKWMAAAINSSKETDISLLPMPVSRKQEIAKTFSVFADQIDTLLFIPDATVISETMVRYIAKQSLLKQIAVVGYNNFFLEAGAVMSFSINYTKVGTRGAQLAEEVLAGGQCNLMDPPFEVQWNPKAWDFIKRPR
jgi:putative ABC transport system substrate-binding protein